MKTITLTTLTLATVLAPSNATGNDNAAPKRVPPRPAVPLADPTVVRAIEHTLLGQGVDHQDLADGVAEVQARAIKAVRQKPAPTQLGGWKALCCTIAERMMISAGRTEKKRSRYHAGLCENPDEHGPLELSRGRERDPVDRSRQLEVLRKQFEAGDMPPQGQEILMGVMDGLSAQEIGEELGLPRSVVKNRLYRMRKLFKEKLASLSMLVLLLLVATLFAAPFGGLATRDADPLPQRPPTTMTTTVATALRGEALSACETRQWDLCLGRLDEAARVDLEGNEAPEVRALRARAEHALEEQDRELEAKPRP